jgi:hypothetical protein
VANRKNTTKKNNSYNVTAVTAISEKMKISKQYVRQCIRGDRNSISADIIRKEYKDLVRKIQELVLNF